MSGELERMMRDPRFAELYRVAARKVAHRGHLAKMMELNDPSIPRDVRYKAADAALAVVAEHKRTTEEGRSRLWAWLARRPNVTNAWMVFVLAWLLEALLRTWGWPGPMRGGLAIVQAVTAVFLIVGEVTAIRRTGRWIRARAKAARIGWAVGRDHTG